MLSRSSWPTRQLSWCSPTSLASLRGRTSATHVDAVCAIVVGKNIDLRYRLHRVIIENVEGRASNCAQACR